MNEPWPQQNGISTIQAQHAGAQAAWTEEDAREHQLLQHQILEEMRQFQQRRASGEFASPMRKTRR